MPDPRRQALADVLREPVRYELHAPDGAPFEAARRCFFDLLGGGLVVVLALREPTAPAQAEPGRDTRADGRQSGPDVPDRIGAWLHLGEDGRATGYSGKVDVGQNSRTSLAQAVADELRLPLDRVDVVLGDTDLCPYDRGTVGSRTTPDIVPRLRRVAAAARERLARLAAEQWGVDSEAVTLTGGEARCADGRSLGLGALVRGRQRLEIIGDDQPTTPPADWTVAGRPAGKANGRDLVTGRHRYTVDFERPGMVYGAVLRPARFGARLLSVDPTPAEQFPGTTVVRDGEFVGVVGASGYACHLAVQAMAATWSEGEDDAASSDHLSEWLKAHPFEGDSPRSQPRVTEEGDAAAALAGAQAAGTAAVEAAYSTAPLAHAPLEPRCAVAEWDEAGRLTVWTGTQRPFGVRVELAEAFGLSEGDVRVIVPDTGSGYGGKHTGECALEAARLARAAGRPVKLMWGREEEFTWAYFRPPALMELAAAARRDGTLTAWRHVNHNAGSAGLGMPYRVANLSLRYQPTVPPLRQGSYRALSATANFFARESLMDELAQALGLDPLAFRLRNLGDELHGQRLRNVLQAAAERGGWGGELPAGIGRGLAGGTEKGSYVATCAEVTVTGDEVRVDRLVTAFECGAIVNPLHLENQVEGAVVMGLGGAMWEAIRFAGGVVENPRFSDYRVPRFGDLPRLETILLNRPDLPSAGGGETPICAVAPAVANAIFAACGRRLRSLPLAPEGRLGV